MSIKSQAAASSIYKPQPILKSIDFDLGNTDAANLRKAGLLLRKGRKVECETLCDKLISEETSTEDFLLIKAKIQVDAGFIHEALTMYDQVLKRMPYCQEALRMKCVCKYENDMS